jgi:hypothetical protein
MMPGVAIHLSFLSKVALIAVPAGVSQVISFASRARSQTRFVSSATSWKSARIPSSMIR